MQYTSKNKGFSLPLRLLIETPLLNLLPFTLSPFYPPDPKFSSAWSNPKRLP
ncbi:hypothetical protein AVDCRST_MAG94-4176 [uncultured Leptolyngbya sp.]|uniref:Uncharacterized protein n=1 Tax=uncultured Leptolyngbya sp. TaxID=332963 RepID=A0A6J4MWY7_9CYAN|nr:hypothetical protein AVDCRST_MAG94-4176 [uncultured Leptolyngbya sp.]